MRAWTLAFFAGVLLLHTFAHLPNVAWCLVIIFIYGVFLYFTPTKMWRWVRLPLALALGFAWTLGYANWYLAWELPKTWEAKPVQVVGYIASIPERNTESNSFLFAVEHGPLIRLVWYDKAAPHLMVGDKWQFQVRLKRIHGTQNPGGNDYEAVAFAKDIRAGGYVVNGANNLRLAQQRYKYFLSRVRQHIKEEIQRHLLTSKTSPWIVALTVGERAGISQEQWQVLRNTGTNHLMVVAGLHIGCMVALIYFLVLRLWRCFPVVNLRMPAQQVAAFLTLVAGITYGALAGFSIPSQRAVIMLAVFLGTTLLRRKLVPWQAWSTALLIVLFINPISVITSSFWLSFGTVALIIYGLSGRLAAHNFWWKWGRPQWVIAFGLVPLSLWFFQSCSLVSFVANTICIPLVGFLVVPLSLLGCCLLIFSGDVGGYVLWLADRVLSGVWAILTWLSALHGATWQQMLPDYRLLLTTSVAVVILLLPRSFPAKTLGLIFLLPILLWQPAKPRFGDIWLTLLDVGQGLAAVVQTEQHILVFDTGGRLNDSFDMGASVVVPFLQYHALTRVDMLVISHGDNDHIGGAAAVQRELSVKSIMTSVPDRFPRLDAHYCLQDVHWNWDGVDFTFLHPTQGRLGLDNNSCCVLKISNGAQKILLTGDIEKNAEEYLLQNTLQDLAADILIAPHHGSKTSSTINFVSRVHPRYVLFPVGYLNRYHFPNRVVVERYKKISAQLFDTAQAGAISFHLRRERGIQRPELYRLVAQHYWNDTK